LRVEVTTNNKGANPADARPLRSSWRRSLAIAALLVQLLASGCAAHKSIDQAAGQTGANPPQSTDNAPLPGPEAKIHISFARPNDFLGSLMVTKYSAAQTVLTLDAKDGSAASIVRFDGGVGVWQVDVDKSLLSDVPVLGHEKGYAPTEVKYGAVPAHFVQSVPDGGPPEPLEPDHYYIFTVTRASGSASYEAVKVDSDGSLEAYEAEPRAGTSFRLCCNVGADFTITATPRNAANPPAP
jgi:hypothetical protein